MRRATLPVSDVAIYREGDFPPELECQAVSFVRIAWPFAFAGEDRYETHLWPGWNTAHVVVAERGVLISYAAVIETTVECAGERYRTLGLSSVFTYPQFRREGYGGRVLEAATRYIGASGADVAMLWCDRALERFYARRGWSATRGSATLVGDRDAPTREDHGGHLVTRMMLFVSDRGRAARSAFESEPVYVGLYTW
jgi:GNAT superfamily N-acetyltransferase